MKLDNDFLKVQSYANQLFDSLPVIKDYKTDKDLITQLQYSCVCYGRKLLSLFDKYQVLQKRSQEGGQSNNSLALNLAKLLSTSPTEQNISDKIIHHMNLNVQLQSKIEYLKNAQQDSTFQKMFSQEQKLSKELQDVTDKLILELKQYKDQNIQLAEEIHIKDDLIKQFQQQLHSLNNSTNQLLRSPNNKSPYSSASKFQSGAKSSIKQTRFQQQLINTLQTLVNLVKQQFEEYVTPSDIQFDFEQLLTDDTQLLALNTSNLIREISQQLEQKEELVLNLIKGQEIQISQHEQIAKQSKQQDNQAIGQYKQIQQQAQQLQQFINKAKDQRKQEIEKAFNSDIPIFVIIDDFMDQETQLMIEKHNQRVQLKLNDLAIQLKKRIQQSDLQQGTINKIKVIIKEGLNRIEIGIQELQRMADSNEAQTMLKYCKTEIEQITQSLLEEGQNSLENIVTQQHKNWSNQFEQMQSYYNEQYEKLLIENENIQEKLNSISQLSQGLHSDNEQMVRKLKQAQQELLQFKEQHITDLEEIEIIKRQIQEGNRIHEQQDLKQRQILEQADQEVERLKRELMKQQQENQQKNNQNEDKIKVLETENKTYKQQLDTIEKDFGKLKQQRQAQDQISDNDRQQLRKQLDDKKKQIIQVQQENKKIHEEAVKQIQELQDELNSISDQLVLRDNEIKQLNKTLSELEEFSRKQIDVIRTYEEKLTSTIQQKKQLENENDGNDQALQQYQTKYQSLLQQLNQSKIENEKLLKDLGHLQKTYAKQVEQMDIEFKDKINKQSEIHKILKEEARNLKAQLELKLTQFRQSEQDLQEKNIELEKAQKICKQLNQQLNEFKQKIDLFEGLKKDNLYQSEQQNKQIQILQQENFSYRKELEKIQQQNSSRQKSNYIQDQAMKDEIQNLKNEIQRMDSLLGKERQAYESEIKNYQSQLDDYNKVDLSLRQKSGQSNGSAFYENLIEAKENEIARLTGIVKSLTELRK